MHSKELIAALAEDAAPIDRARVERRFHAQLLAGVLLSIAAMVLLIGPRPDLAEVWPLPMFWLKLWFPASLAAAALFALRRLGYPGMRLGRVPAAAAFPLVVVWMIAGGALLASPPGERLPLVFGETWMECPITIAWLSAPSLWLAFRAARELAPTRLALAGLTAGLFAGAAAAFAYALHCPEMQAPFLAVWYVLGMLIPAAAGAVLGRSLLRW